MSRRISELMMDRVEGPARGSSSRRVFLEDEPPPVDRRATTVDWPALEDTVAEGERAMGREVAVFLERDFLGRRSESIRAS